MAIACSFIGVIPLLLRARLTASLIMGIISTLVLWFAFWAFTASTVGPFFGPCLLVIGVLWFISAAIDSFSWIMVFPILLGIVFFVILPCGSAMFRSKEFAALIGPMEERVWTQDIQVKDPRHIRLSNRENAIYLAKNSISRGGNALGSQFEVSENCMTLQKINGVFWYVVPLDFRDDYGVWSNTHFTPGYLMINADDVDAEPIYKALPSERRLAYTPNAFFDSNLERHLRMNGYLNVGLTDCTFEIDEEGNPWWVVSTYQPTIINSGEKITGVVIVDPTTGEQTFYPLGKIPEWVDRAMPKENVKTYLKWWGKYNKGFENTLPILGSKKDVLEPEEPIMVYGSDGTLYWVVGITSKNNADTSLVALVYVNSRTGKATYYKTNGGSTDKALLDAVINNKDVTFKHLHPADPQIYNLYGTMASIMPLLNVSHARQGVAIIDVTDIQKVAVGDDLYEALNAYQEKIGDKAKASLEKTRSMAKLTGIVDRIHSEFQNAGTIYRVHIKGTPHLFIGGKNLSRKITVTEPGDEVIIEYYASGEEEIPMSKFDNPSIKLETTKAQLENTQRSVQMMDEQRTEKTSETVKERVKNLTPQQLKELEEHLPQQ